MATRVIGLSFSGNRLMVGFVKKHKLLLAILLIAIAMRVVKLDYLELFGDEIDAGYQAYSLLVAGRDYRGNFLPTYMESMAEWRAPLMMYSMVPFIRIFGLNEWGVRLNSAFWGVMGIWGFYLLIRKLGGDKTTGLVASLVLALTPWHVQYSRSGFELTIMSALIIWGLYFLATAWQGRRKWKTALGAALLGLSFYAYNTANVYVPLLILWLFLWEKMANRSKISWTNGIGVIGVVILVALPLAVNVLNGHGADRFKLLSVWGNKDMVREINLARIGDGDTAVSRLVNNKLVYSVRKVAKNYANPFGSRFLVDEGDVTFRHSLHRVGNILWVTWLMGILGIVGAIKNVAGRSSLFWLGFLLLSPIPSSLTVDGAYHASRLFLMVFPLAYFAGLGWRWLSSFRGTRASA